MARERPTQSAPGLVMGPCIFEIDRIDLFDIILRETTLSGFSEDGQKYGIDNQNIPTLFKKRLQWLTDSLAMNSDDIHEDHVFLKESTQKTALPPTAMLIGTNVLTKLNFLKFSRDIIRTNNLSKFELTRKNAPSNDDDAQQTTDKRRSQNPEFK
ncbi:hypothetical protein DPMN_088406 [Dreissena polymorpha]|uniref:Uncharacterized protein n=1 Tax=Dreissena polymorpha TaxID=45954 RepID=A0A9D4KUH1_DREPO|nr:hypothetical protein DPMN_088406 [Dreissena polymorpha]